MGNLFDIILVLIVVATVLINYRRGMLKILKPFKFISSVVIAMNFKMSSLVQKIVGNFISTEQFKATVNERVNAMWGDKINSAAGAEIVNEHERFAGIFGPFNSLFGDIQSYCQTAFMEGTENLVEQVSSYATNAIIVFLQNAIGFVLVFLACMILLSVAMFVLQLLFSKGILKILNQILGGIAGLLFGFVIAWIASILIVNFGPIMMKSDVGTITGGFLGIVKWFHDSFILSQLFGIVPI